MRKIFILFSFFICSLSFGQGYYEIPNKFYPRIDSMRTLDCCDSGYSSIKIIYDIPLYEYPIFDNLDIKEYEMKVMDESYVDILVQNLVDAYYEISPSKRKEISKSCFKIKEKYNIEFDKTGANIYWVEGILTITFIFQSEDKYFGQPWFKKLYYKVKR